MDKFAPLLHSKWVRGDNLSVIEGRWAEDGTVYCIIIPYQLRDITVELQNKLYSIYHELEDQKEKVRRLSQKWNDFFDG